MHNKSVHMVSWILIIVGGLNWGLVGLGGLMGERLEPRQHAPRLDADGGSARLPSRRSLGCL